MPIPQVSERIKEAPAVVLRAVFAGVGQLLLAAEKVRGRALEQLSQAGQRERAGGRPAPGAVPGPAPTIAAAPPPAKTAAAPAPEETAAAPTPATTAAAPAAAPGAAPIPGYDELSIASLRARLRVLDASTLRSLLAYERAHAGRDTVITMFERRLAKITGEAG